MSSGPLGSIVSRSGRRRSSRFVQPPTKTTRTDLPPTKGEVSIDDSLDVWVEAKFADDGYVQHLRREVVLPVGFLNHQNDIDAHTRRTLVEWMFEERHFFRLTPETFFLAVNLVDRYLSIAVVSRDGLQLVGVAALFLASKFEEVDPPALGALARRCRNAYPKSAIRSTEVRILQALEYRVAAPTVYFFLYKWLGTAETSGATTRRAYNRAVRCLLDTQFVAGIAPSRLAAAVIRWTLGENYPPGEARAP